MKRLAIALLLLVTSTVDAQFFRTNTPTGNKKGELVEFSYGSASLISPDVLITASHCVHNGILVVQVGDKAVIGKPILDDQTNDVAIVRLAEPIEGVTPITLGVANVGEKLWAGGFGSGKEKYQLQTGPLIGKYVRPNGQYASFIEGFRPRHGDSGGPVLNARGDLVGVVTHMTAEHEDAYCLFHEPMTVIRESSITKLESWGSVINVEPYLIVHVQERERLRSTIIQMYLETYMKQNGLPVPKLPGEKE